jgi:hypothetical protein
MNSKIMAQAPGYVAPVFNHPPPAPGQPLPAGATVTSVTDTSTSGFDVNKYVGWITAIDTVSKQVNTVQKGIIPSGVNFGTLASMVAAGAAAGAALAGVGAAVGAVVAAVAWVAQNWKAITGTGQPHTNFANGNIHYWATQYMPQEYLDWARDTYGTPHFTSIEQMASGVLAFWLEKYGVVLTATTGTKFYSGVWDATYIEGLAPGGNIQAREAAAAKLYASLGVDYNATRDVRLATGNVDQKHIVQFKALVTTPAAFGLNPELEYGDDSNAGLVVGAIAVVGGLVYLGSRKQESPQRKRNR